MAPATVLLWAMCAVASSPPSSSSSSSSGLLSPRTEGSLAEMTEWVKKEEVFCARLTGSDEEEWRGVAKRTLQTLAGGVPLKHAASGEEVVRNNGEGVATVQVRLPPPPGYVVDRSSFMNATHPLHFLATSAEASLAQILSKSFFSEPPLLTPYVFIGGAGSGVPLHRHAAAVLFLLEGTKRWRIAKRGVTPGSKDVVKFVQNAGEVVYIPEGWWHAVSNGDGVVGNVALGLQETVSMLPAMKAVQLASGLARDGHNSEAATLLEAALAEGEDVSGVLAEAYAKLQCGEDSAEACHTAAEKCLEVDAKNVDCRLAACRAALVLSRVSVVCEGLSARSFPILKAQYLVENDQVDAAVQVYEAAVRMKKFAQSSPLFLAYAQLLVASQQREAASFYLRKALQINPEDATALQMLSHMRGEEL